MEKVALVLIRVVIGYLCGFSVGCIIVAFSNPDLTQTEVLITTFKLLTFQDA